MRLPVARPPVQVLGDAVLLQGAAVVDAWWLISLGIREAQRRDGITPSPRLRELHRALEQVAADMRTPPAARSGHADTDTESVAAQSESSVARTIGTAQVARRLGLTERHVRRLVPALGGYRVRGAWQFDEAAVDAFTADRTESDA